MTINKIHKGEDEKAPCFSQTAFTKDSSESADPAALCDWCDHPSGYLPPVLDNGKWIHFGRDGDGQICTAPTCVLCGHPWTFSYGEEGSHDIDGRCYFPIGPNASGGQRSCYCKCVFPTSQDAASPKERNPTTVPDHSPASPAESSSLTGNKSLRRTKYGRALLAAVDDAYKSDVIDTEMEDCIIGENGDYASKDEWIEAKLDEWLRR